MNIVVTGTGSFLGRNLSASLLAKGYKAWNFSREKHPQIQAIGVDTICGNLQDKDSCF